MKITSLWIAKAAGAVFALAAANPAAAEWISGKDEEGLPFAYVVNESRNLFGQWCNKEADACFWVLATQRGCETGADVPGVINTEKGSAAISMQCLATTTLDGKLYHRLVLSPFDTVRTALQGQKRIALAMPMQDVSFAVLRFNTTGADAAIGRMESAVRIYLNTNKKSTKDQSL